MGVNITKKFNSSANSIDLKEEELTGNGILVIDIDGTGNGIKIGNIHIADRLYIYIYVVQIIQLLLVIIVLLKK